MNLAVWRDRRGYPLNKRELQGRVEGQGVSIHPGESAVANISDWGDRLREDALEIWRSAGR
jgi:hypothetical protein